MSANMDGGVDVNVSEKIGVFPNAGKQPENRQENRNKKQ